MVQPVKSYMTTFQPHSRIAAMAKILGCSVDQINTQLDKNARTLRAMHAQAVKTGKRVNGFTANDLDALAESYEKRTRV